MNLLVDALSLDLSFDLNLICFLVENQRKLPTGTFIFYCFHLPINV